jgi:hypothetical protein
MSLLPTRISPASSLLARSGNNASVRNTTKSGDSGWLPRSLLANMLRMASGPRIVRSKETSQFAVDPFSTRNPTNSKQQSVRTLSGSGERGYLDGSGGIDGTARFDGVYGVAVDTTGNVYVADSCNHRIRRIAPDGTTTTLAGNGIAGYADGTGGANGTAQFNYPYGVAVDQGGNLYVADASNHCVRKISALGDTTTLAGNGTPRVLRRDRGCCWLYPIRKSVRCYG